MGWESDGQGGEGGEDGGGAACGVMVPLGAHWRALSYRLRCGGQGAVRQVWQLGDGG